MLLELGQAAGKQAHGVAGRMAPVVERLLGLELDLGIHLADVALGMLSGMVVELHVRFRVPLGRLRVGEQLLARLLEVVVVELDLAGAEAPFRRPVIDVLAIAPVVAGERNERRRGVSGNRLVRRFPFASHIVCLSEVCLKK